MRHNNGYKKVQRVYLCREARQALGNKDRRENRHEDQKLGHEIQNGQRIGHIKYARRIRQCFKDLLPHQKVKK